MFDALGKDVFNLIATCTNGFFGAMSILETLEQVTGLREPIVTITRHQSFNKIVISGEVGRHVLTMGQKHCFDIGGDVLLLVHITIYSGKEVVETRGQTTAYRTAEEERF